MKLSLQINPLNKSASWEDIKALRDKFEQAPIEVTPYGLVQVDSLSESRMREAMMYFDDLPKNEQGGIYWKMADNTLVSLSQTDLTEMLAECLRLRAVRAAHLHARAELYRVFPPLLRDIQDIQSWLV